MTGTILKPILRRVIRPLVPLFIRFVEKNLPRYALNSPNRAERVAEVHRKLAVLRALTEGRKP